jgi:hypothetical protein
MEIWASEFYEALAKMAPTKEEELKLKDYSGDLLKLNPAERFLKDVLDVPFAFKRVDAMLYGVNFDTEMNSSWESFGTLEVKGHDIFYLHLNLIMLPQYRFTTFSEVISHVCSFLTKEICDIRNF